MAPGEAVELGGWRNTSLAADSAPGAALDALDVCAVVCCHIERTVAATPGVGRLEAHGVKRQLPPPWGSPLGRSRGARRCELWCRAGKQAKT
jgi:hypothetical protein